MPVSSAQDSSFNVTGGCAAKQLRHTSQRSHQAWGKHYLSESWCFTATDKLIWCDLASKLWLVECTESTVQAYVSYKVCTKTSLHQYRQRQTEVLRRFKDFAWLRDQLQEQNRGEQQGHGTVSTEDCLSVCGPCLTEF